MGHEVLGEVVLRDECEGCRMFGGLARQSGCMLRCCVADNVVAILWREIPRVEEME